MGGYTSPHIQRSAALTTGVPTADRRDPCIHYTTTAVSFLRILQHWDPDRTIPSSSLISLSSNHFQKIVTSVSLKLQPNNDRKNLPVESEAFGIHQCPLLSLRLSLNKFFFSGHLWKTITSLYSLSGRLCPVVPPSGIDSRKNLTTNFQPLSVNHNQHKSLMESTLPSFNRSAFQLTVLVLYSLLSRSH